MARAASRIVDSLHSHAQSLDRFLQRMEGLSQERRLPQRDVTLAYGGAFLSFYVRLEGSIEELFMGILMRRVTVSSSRVRPLVEISSEVVARDVVRAGRPHVAWLPYDHTKARAHAFLSGGRPFASLSATDIQALENARIIRNAVAHAGSSAADQFKRQFTAGKPLPPAQLTPPGYLRGIHAPGQTRFNYTLAECLLVMGNLCQ